MSAVSEQPQIATVVVAQTNPTINVTSLSILTNDVTYYRDRTYRLPDLGTYGLSLSSPDPAVSFLALTGWAADSSVPDTYGTVGTNFVLTMLNTGVMLQMRGGGVITTNSLEGFWTSTNISAYSSVFDPKTTYDPYFNRWIAVAGVDEKLPSSAILIGVSRTSSPTNFGDAGWNLRSLKPDTNGAFWADQPAIGFNKDWIVVQANETAVGTNTGLPRSQIWVFNKTNLYAGNFGPYTNFINADPSADTRLAYCEIPALTYDNSVSNLYLLQCANGNVNGSGYLRVFCITGAIGSEALNLKTGYVVATNFSWADNLSCRTCGSEPEAGTNGFKIQVPDGSRLTSVVYRNGFLWCAHTIFLPTNNPTRSAVQWWQIRPETTELLQRGTIDDPTGAKHYSFPSIAINRFNDVLIGHNTFSSNTFPTASYSFRAFYDAPGELRQRADYQPGLAEFGVPDTRWGDYSGAAVDPINDADLWTIQEYALTNGVYDGDRRDFWGTQWAQVKVDLPTNDNFNVGIVLSGAQGNTNGTNIRATGEVLEPAHAGNTNTVSVWFRWTAPTNADVVMYVGNLTFDSILAVYTGSAVTNLSLVASNHGGVGGSQVVFAASSGTTYNIAVDSFGSSPHNQGTFTLYWDQASVPFFTIQPRGWDVYMGTNVTFSAAAIGSPAPTYIWQYNGTNIPGATGSSYTKSNVQTNDTGNYTVVASNSSGSVTSSVAHLEVYSTQRALISEATVSSGGPVRFIVSGITGASYVVEASTNLTTWTPINTNVTTFTNLAYDLTNFAYRFYRVRYQP